MDKTPGKDNRDIWDNDEEYDEGWAVGREQYWSDEEEDQTKQHRSGGLAQHRQLTNEGTVNNPSPYSEEEENDSEGEESTVHESEDEVVGVGQSDTQEETSSGSDGKMSHASDKGHKEWTQKLQQMHVKETWEDDSILDGEEETINKGGANKRRSEGSNVSSDGEDEETITHTESLVDENDREYEPTSTESEESALSTKGKKATNKKQTMITNTFHLNKKELRAMTQKKGTKENEMSKRQTMSMMTKTK